MAELKKMEPCVKDPINIDIGHTNADTTEVRRN